jgi:hypothetical protein
MAKSLDLNKLKSEIETRKKEKGIITENAQGIAMLPRDTFLNSLLTSLQTGKNSPMLNNIKTMNARADIISGAIKTGVVTTEAINKINELKSSAVSVVAPSTQRQAPAQSLNESEEYPERDGSIYEDILRKSKNVTLADSMQEFVGKKTPTPMKSQSAPMNLNEQYLNESVKKAVDNYLIENFGPVLEEAIKGTILEMYAVERIKEVLHENKDMIKTVVIEVIKEIQAKAKQNKAQ